MFNTISKFFQPENFMPDSHEIAQRAAAIVRFQNLSGIRFDGPVMYRDLMSALLRSQCDINLMYSKASKLEHCVKMFNILDAYIDAQRKISKISANEIVVCCIDLRFAAEFIIENGSFSQKDELKRIYGKVLDIALRYHDSSTNIKNIGDIISTIREGRALLCVCIFFFFLKSVRTRASVAYPCPMIFISRRSSR